MPSPSPTPRRKPRQERSLFTVDAIFQSVTQIVATQGEAGLTSNRIAEVAGVSIGSLYQYFPSKEAILAAMLDRHCEMVMLELDALLAAFAGGTDVQRALARLSWQIDYRAAMLVAVRGASERLAFHLQRLAARAGALLPTPAQLFVLTRAFMGTVRYASLEQSPLLDRPELEQALVQLSLAFLIPGAEPSLA
jgi:AcrR family transcriptional regulator